MRRSAGTWEARLWRQVEPVEMLAAGAADIEHVLEALGGDQRHGLDAVLDDGVGHQRRAVHQVVDVDGVPGPRRQAPP